MDLLGVWRKGVDPAGNAVVEAGADADHQVAVMHGMVGLIGTVHAQHAEPVRVRGREGAEAHQRGGNGNAGHGLQFAQQFRGAGSGIDDTATGIEDGRRGGHDEIDNRSDRISVWLGLRLVGRFVDAVLADIGACCELDVLRNVDDDRAGATGGGDQEGLVHDAGEIVHVGDEVIVLGTGARDADRVALLKGIGADQMGRNLAAEDDHGNGVHHRVGNRRDHVGSAGP